MKLHVVDANGPVFWLESRFDDKDAIKAAGFLWHPAAGCRPGCGGCAAGLGKVWWTRRADNAKTFLEAADDDARARLTGEPRVAPKIAKPAKVKKPASLLEQILAAPDDHALKRVYADQLIERGDPRGEFIQIQLERERTPTAELAKREQQLLAKHEGRWLGPVRHAMTSWRWRRGFVYAVTVNEARWHDGAADLVAHEPVRRVRVTGVRNLPALAAMPELAKVAALSLPNDRLVAASVRRLVESPHLQHLRGLDLDDNGIGDDGLRVLASARLAALVELRLSGCAFGPRGGSITPAGLEALLSAPWLAQLRELDLRANTLGLDEVDPRSVTGKLLGAAPLQAGALLDITHNHLTAKAAKHLVDSPLPRLRLAIASNDFTPKAIASLAKRFDLVERQRSSTGELADDAALDHA